MTDAANFLAVDLGASSGRVLLGAWDGQRFALSELHRFANRPVPLPGALHWDLLALWAEILHGVRRYAREHSAPLAAIGIDSWAVDFGLLDESGHLLGNPFHYRDARTQRMPERVASIIPPAELFERTGIQVLPLNTLYQLFSLAQRNDPQLRAAQTLLLVPDLLHYFLTGHIGAEYTNASTTQFLDCRRRIWATDLLARLNIPTHILPPIVAPGAPLGALRGEIVDQTGLAHAPPVIASATHDTASAVAGIPGLDSASAYISSGTWSLVGVETHQPITSERARALNVTNEGGVGGTIRLLKNVAGLWLLQECQRSLERDGLRPSWDELLGAAVGARPFVSIIDPDAPEFLAPADMPAAIAAFCARSGQPAPSDVGALVRCCLESLALRYRWVIEALEALLGQRLATIRIVGGGSQNRLLCQMTADACGRPVVAGPVEATALGNI
ncbi:MAG: rhamnulokinase, partial [Chloroflexales bacterium]|nr:rhamnulokinase [Chloroflexales bacterium]